MTKVQKGVLNFLIGVSVVFMISQVRMAEYGLAEYQQFPAFLSFYFICGLLSSWVHKTLWPYPFLFLLPTIAMQVTGLIVSERGLFSRIGEILMIIPGFGVGFYFFRWPMKYRVTAAILLPVIYFFYISKINPKLSYYNNSVRLKSIQSIPDRPLPNFQFKKPDSSILSLNDYRGKVVMIDFYFNHCSQCIMKMPALAKINNHYKNDSNFVLVSVHRGGSETFSYFLSFLNRFPKGLNYVYDSTTAASEYLKIEGYPVEILIDKQGKIREQFAGYNKDIALIYEKTTINKIDALLNEKN